MLSNKSVFNHNANEVEFVEDASYWQKRCELAEKIVSIALDNDGVNNLLNAPIINKWQEFVAVSEYFAEPILIISGKPGDFISYKEAIANNPMKD